MFAVDVTEDGHFWLKRIEEIIRASELPTVMGLDQQIHVRHVSLVFLYAAIILWAASDSVPSESNGPSRPTQIVMFDRERPNAFRRCDENGVTDRWRHPPDYFLANAGNRVIGGPDKRDRYLGKLLGCQ
jgi:hypothetical protein